MDEASPAGRHISTQQAAFIGVAAMVGAGIFSLLGAAGEVAGAAVWLSFLIAGGIAALQGYSFGKAMPVGEILDAAVTRRRSMLVGNIPGQVMQCPPPRPLPSSPPSIVTTSTPASRIFEIVNVFRS